MKASRGGANSLFRTAPYPVGMDSLHYSRSALIKSIVLCLLVAGPVTASIAIAPDLFDGRGGGIGGLLLRAIGPEGRVMLAGSCLVVLAVLVFRAVRLLCGSGIAARFDPQGLELNNGWQARTAPWREVLGADIVTQEVRIRGTIKSFDILTVRLNQPNGSERRFKIHLRELDADWTIATRWCEDMREVQQRAFEEPASTSGVDRVFAPAARSFGRRVVDGT